MFSRKSIHIYEYYSSNALRAAHMRPNTLPFNSLIKTHFDADIEQ
jgi:hypothetical protein